MRAVHSWHITSNLDKLYMYWFNTLKMSVIGKCLSSTSFIHLLFDF